jgi:hypothetical protein
VPPPGKTKVTLLGKLRYTEAEGLQYSANGKWLEALPNADTYNGHGDPNYQLAAKALLELQRREPQRVRDDLDLSPRLR